MKFAHQFSSRPDGNNTAEARSFTLRTALSAIPFVSDLCGVDVQGFQERSSQALSSSKELSVWLTFGFPTGSKNFLQAPFVFLEKFLFCTDMFGSSECPSFAPRLHIDDGFEIHNFNRELRDLLQSNHQNFLHEVRLRQCVFCTGPL